MMGFKGIARKSMQVWARTGRALGYLHWLVDSKSEHLADKSLLRKIYGANKIACNLSDHVQSRIYFFGAYEPIEAFLFLNLITPGSHIVDAGANIGFYSLIAASRAGSHGRVYAFEPVPSNFSQFQKNIEVSHHSNIQLFKMGLWSSKETLTFSLASDMEKNAGSFTAAPSDGTVSEYDCPCIPLDQLVLNGEIDKVDLIKMDIEGAELMAIQGASQTIEKFLPTVLMEINQSACVKMGYSSSEIDKTFLDLGYKIFLVNSTPEKSKFIASTEKIEQSNVFFVSPKDQQRFQTTWNYREIRTFFARN